ncbi:hypothetical protein CBS147353_11654 [Aspergillus niger]|nr:hypothetical protein CBS147353_11654 [Aspergillus niger]
MGRASDVAIPEDSGAERGSPTTCPADVTARGDWNEIRDDGNSTLRSDIGDNAGWGPPPNATALPSSLMPANNSTGNPTADSWHSMPWASEPYSWETLPASFWGWTWSQSGYLTGSETDGFSHPSIPALQAAGWPLVGDAEEHQDPRTGGAILFRGSQSQGPYSCLAVSPNLSSEPQQLLPLSVATRSSSITENAPESFPRFPHVQRVDNAVLSLPNEPSISSPPGNPVPMVSANFRNSDFHHHSMHQEPFAPAPVRNIELLLPPWLQTMMEYQETDASLFDTLGVESHDL